jgi:SAM-dependent methyltransferase
MAATVLPPEPLTTGTHVRAEFVQRLRCINCRSPKLKQLSSRLFYENPLYDILATDPWGENPLPYLEGKRWTLVECDACSQKFHRDVLSPEWNEIRFSRWMTHEAIQACLRREMTPAGSFRRAVQNTQHVLRLERMTRGLRKDNALRILDFGCGYGEFLAMCSQYGCEAVGVDRAHDKRRNARHPVIFPTIGDLIGALGPGRFHVVTLFETLEHLDDPRSTLEELGTLVAPGGILVLETPDCTGVDDITTAEESWRIQPLDHINAFTPATLRSLAGRCGFAPIGKPGAHVTASWVGVAKAEVKSVLRRFGFVKPTTQQYFRKE